MIEFVKNWVTNIVMVIFFIAFIEILLPSNNMKKYINMVLGLLIIIVLINPIIKLMSSDINIDREVFYNIQSYNTLETSRDSKYVKTQNQQIIQAYRQKLKNEIAEFVGMNKDYSVLDVKVSINEDLEDKDFGRIMSIEVYLGTQNNYKQDPQNIGIDEIEKVSINADKTNINQNIKENPSEFGEIIDSISSYYKVPKDKIIISLNT